jgi:hypothetical protein
MHFHTHTYAAVESMAQEVALLHSAVSNDTLLSEAANPITVGC